jgi:tetratricopeptide (TPR) repeat protein
VSPCPCCKSLELGAFRHTIDGGDLEPDLEPCQRRWPRNPRYGIVVGMGRRGPLAWATKAVKAVAVSMGTTGGRVAAAATAVAALSGLLTNVVTNKPNPVLWVVLGVLVLAAMILAAVLQPSPQPQPTVATLASVGLYSPFGDGPYGDAAQLDWFFARMAQNLSRMPFAASIQSSPSGAEPRSMVNRIGERELLVRALRADQPSVIVVHGPPGVGKSTLVTRVLMETDLSGTTVRRYDLPGDRFHAKRLCEDIDSSMGPGTAPGSWEDVLTRLEAALRVPDGGPVPIVVDGAQFLLDPDSHTMISLELAEAIGMIACGRRRVKLILIVQEPAPVAKAGSEWLASAVYVWVGGLARKDFETCLRRLDPEGEFGLAALGPAERDGLHHALKGIPRLAELFRTVLDLSGDRRNAVQLARDLARAPAGAAEQLLSRKLVGCLSDEQRRVIVGLAAYGTPVTIQQLRDLLEDELSPGRVPALLEELSRAHVIGKTPDRYYISASDVRDALNQLPGEDGPAHLWRQATDILSSGRKEQIRHPEDLDLYFAELEILIHRQLWGSSYELIDTMERHLQQWNAAELLIKYREKIAGQLRENYREMVNYNALGCIYLPRGDFEKAQEAFGNALRNASAVAGIYPHGRRKVYINLAALYLESGETRRAVQCYGDALAMAGEHDDVLDRMAAMSGLADCFRRHGDYHEAIDHGRRALSAAQDGNSPWAADIAVKLARWHSELNQPEEARRLLEVADREVANHPEDPALRVRFLDGRADLLLDADELGEAREVAQQALTRALELNGPVTVLQARTTMAMACLRLDDLSAAKREINRASPYRREGRSLVVLALQALIAFRIDPDGDTSRRFFTRLRREAFQRRERDAKDFAAWDFEGLAICGTGVGGASSLDPAIAAFRRAREQAAPPGLNARMRFWLQILQTKASPGQLDSVLAAAVGAARRPELP